MAIWKIIGIATAIAAFSFTQIPSSSAQECFGKEAFFEAVKHPDTVIMLAKADAAKKLVAKLNENRVKNGMHPVDGRSVAIGVLKDRDGKVQVGVAIFDANDCVISETVIVLPLEHWDGFAKDAGVSAEDFAVLQDS